MDSKRHRLYATRGEAVQAIDTESGKLLATFSGLHGMHGVAIGGNNGFITNGKNNSVTVFDLNFNQVTASLKVTGNGPDAIFYEPTHHRIYTLNHNGGNLTVIDAAILKVIETIPALAELESAVTDGKGNIFVNSEAENKLAVVDIATSKMIATWALGNCIGPTGLAIDIAHDRLFSTCANHKWWWLILNRPGYRGGPLV